MVDNTDKLAKVRREVADNYLREMWEEKVEPKIQKKVAKGKSILAIRGLFSLYSTEQLAEVGREFGYEVDVEQVILGTKLYIYW